MKVKGITTEQLTQCIKNVNEEHGYNIIYNREPEKTGNYINFTIRSEKSGIPGARVSHSGRNMPAASWHAHGYLFDEIFECNPDAIIKSFGKTITINEGNWEDMQIGSMMSPCYMSETSIL